MKLPAGLAAGFLLSLALLAVSRAHETGTAPIYRLSVRVDPGAHTIACEVQIQHPGDSIFILNNDM